MGKITELVKKEEAAFDLTPMIDCVFLLIIFFMVVSEIKKNDYESLVLPVAYSAREAPPQIKTAMIVNITYDYNDFTKAVKSKIIIKGKNYNDDEKLKSFMQLQVRRWEGEGITKEDVQVFIRADHRSEYAKVQKVMVACMKAGLANVTFGAAPDPDKI